MLIDDNPIVNNIYLNKKKISIVKINDVKFENKRKIIFCLIPRHYKNILPKIGRTMFTLESCNMIINCNY